MPTLFGKIITTNGFYDSNHYKYNISFNILFITFIKSVNYINCNIIEFLINKVLDVKPLVPYLSKIMPIV